MNVLIRGLTPDGEEARGTHLEAGQPGLRKAPAGIWLSRAGFLKTGSVAMWVGPTCVVGTIL